MEGIDEAAHARETLERYSGSLFTAFQENLLLTNFPYYVDQFAKERGVEVFQGAMFTVAHDIEDKVTMLDFKIGSPAAALVVDLCSFLPIKSALLLGMCGGLRRRYRVGDYLLPIASIRAEGTSACYFPSDVPALSNFLMQKATAEVMEKRQQPYHIGITYTTNLRFWEGNPSFIEQLKQTRAQAIELECATLFTASYKRKLTLGALLLISDLPLDAASIKTKASSEHVQATYMKEHIALGREVIHYATHLQKQKIKGAYHRNRL
ncbi:MAG: AMP nucleosidase [Chlamydiota bacterium]|nr:AMP nucleosidase [Chlamydiota bacterium]